MNYCGLLHFTDFETFIIVVHARTQILDKNHSNDVAIIHVEIILPGIIYGFEVEQH